MKITEELWNKNSYNVKRIKGENVYSNAKDYYFNVMNKITKKVVLRTEVIEKPTTNEGFKMYTELLLGEDFLKKHDLTPAFNYLVSKTDNDYCNAKYDLSGFGDFPHNVSKKESLQDIQTFPLMLFGDNIVISLTVSNGVGENLVYQTGVYVNDIYYTSDRTDEVKNILESLYEINQKIPNKPNKKDGSIKVDFAFRASDGRIDTYTKFVKIKDIQLDQFDESLPHEKIMNILDKDESGLILLHGEPGCGKSSYIKYLIKECKDKHFVILSQDLLQNMDSFREFLLNQGSKSIIIIEDCENLVKSRERVGSNLIISDFLNITDGIYGDLFRLKFILTFNTDVQTIDSALLRKGRLKCKYKFNKLKGERLKNIAKKIGITLSDSQIHNGLSLADLFNYNDDNGEKQKEVIKIGFNK